MISDYDVTSLIVIILSFLLSLTFTASTRRVLLHRAMLDIPNDRSSHKIPVPRGGGWALLIVLIPGLLSAMLYFDLSLQLVGLLIALLLLAIISWLDDRKGVSARLRLSFHILAAGLGSLSFSSQETLFMGALPFWLDRIIMIVGWAWFINLYNFMDGIDGITGTETISLAVGVGLIMTASGLVDPFLGFLTLILIGVCLGFLAHNWYPAKIFLGDVGSVPLGFLIGFCLLSLAIKGYWVASIILPLYYLADSGLTVFKRAWNGEKIWQAHRQHFYQRAALALGQHNKVVIWIIIANTGLMASALLSLSHPEAALGYSIVIVAVLLGKMHKIASKEAVQL